MRRRDAAGDQAFTDFAVAARARLRNTAYLLCGDWERASDHVQEGLVRVYVAWPRLVRNGGELAYARKAVVSAFLDATRRRSSTELPVADHPGGAAPDDVAGAVADRAALMAALARLPSGSAPASSCATSRTSTSRPPRPPSAAARARSRARPPGRWPVSDPCSRTRHATSSRSPERGACRGERPADPAARERRLPAPRPPRRGDGARDRSPSRPHPSYDARRRGRRARGRRGRDGRGRRLAGRRRPRADRGQPSEAGRADAAPGRRPASGGGARLPGAGVVHEREPEPRQRAVLRRGHRRRPDPLPRRSPHGPAVATVRAHGPGHW